MLIHILDDRDQLLKLILERRPREHDGVGAVDTLQGARCDRIPVLDALRLVDNDKLGRPASDEIEVRIELFVICDLAEIVLRIILLALHAPTRDHPPLAACKTQDFALPLILKLRRADHKHARDPEVAGQDLGRGDRLRGLAKPHLIAYEGASGTRRE